MTEATTMSNPPAPPYEDGDDGEPEFRPRPRRRAHALTFFLAGAALVAAGFFGGVLLQKHEDHGTSTATGTTARARAFAAAGATGTGGIGGTGARAGGFNFGGGAGGGAVTGTVKLVDGKNVYVTDTSGNVVKVATSGSSQLTKTDPATTKDVAPGDIVIVRGTQNSDGSYTASTLVISSASALSGAPATPGG